jgi:hypothetical protein
MFPSPYRFLFLFIPMSLYNSLSKKRKINTEAKSINLTFMYIDDVLSIIQTLRTGLY